MILFISQNRLSNYGNGKTYLELLKGYSDINNFTFISFDNGIFGTPYVYNNFNIEEDDILTKKKNARASFLRLIGLKSFFRDYRIVFFLIHYFKIRRLFRMYNSKISEVYFIGGDSIIGHYLYNLFNCPKRIYFMDDYFFKNGVFLSDFIIKKLIFKSIINSNVCYAISEFLASKYTEKFNKPFIILHRKITLEYESSFSNILSKINKGEKISLIYYGSLHYNRLLSILILSSHFKKFKKINYEIILYSSDYFVLKNILTYFNIVHKGFIEYNELDSIVLSHDGLIMPETYFPSIFSSSKYSFSTKISEYLSYQKPIFICGSLNVSAINFLTKYNLGLHIRLFNNVSIYNNSFSNLQDLTSFIKCKSAIKSNFNNYKFISNF